MAGLRMRALAIAAMLAALTAAPASAAGGAATGACEIALQHAAVERAKLIVAKRRDAPKERIQRLKRRVDEAERAADAVCPDPVR